MTDLAIDLELLRAPSLRGRSGRVALELRRSQGGPPRSGIRDGSLRSGGPTQPVWVSLYLSTDAVLDGGDILLQRLSLRPGASGSRRLGLEVGSSGLPVADGSYHLIARIDTASGAADANPANAISSLLVNAAGSDPVTVWTSTALNAIRSAGSNGKPGVPPTTGTRLMALLSTAMLDSLAGFSNRVSPYRIDREAPAGASRDAALVGAAQRILLRELPGEAALIQEQFAASLRQLKGAARAIEAGLAFGASVADQLLALRAADGSADLTPYTPPEGLPGYVWMPAGDGPTAGVALGPRWGAVTPWLIDSPGAFRSDGLQCRPDVNPDLYAEQLNEVRLYGGLTDTAVTTLQRSAEQTEIALFWAYDRPDTFRPYGQLLDIAMDVAAEQGADLETNARLTASLSTAMADAVICAWAEKYANVQPRPFDVITGRFSEDDGLAATSRDPQWRSLLSSINGVDSPPFPDFLSGHSVMGGAFASVMTRFFGDSVVFSASSQELPGVTRRFDGVTEAGVQRNSFYEAGYEDAISRVYGGVHTREACLDGFAVGLRVGEAVVSGLLGAPGSSG